MKALHIFSVCFTSLLGALLGYDIGVISGAIYFIASDLGLSTWQEEVVVGSLNIVSAFGGLLVGPFADRLGRKAAICLAQILFVAGTLTLVLSYAFKGLLTGRVLMGLGCGCGFVVGPLYAAELSPPEQRGMLISFFEIAIGLGILLGYTMGYACRDMPLSVGWRVMLGCGCVPPLVSLCFLAALPESPRYLWAVGRRQQAREVLQLVVGPEEVESSCEEIAAGVEGAAEPRAALRELLCPRSRVRRLMVTVGLGLTLSQQANGNEAIIYYMPTIIQGAGIRGQDALLGFTVLVGVCRTLFILVGSLLVDRLGRRPLLLVSTAGITASLVLLAAGLWCSTLWLTLLGLCSFVASYAIGIGPLNMVVVSEIFPFRLRAVAMSLAIFFNRLTSGVVATCFLSLVEWFSLEATFGFFAVIAFCSWLFVLWRVPETRGRSLEDMEAYFEQLVAERSQLDKG